MILGQWLWLSWQSGRFRNQSWPKLFTVDCIEKTEIKKRGRDWAIKKLRFLRSFEHPMHVRLFFSALNDGMVSCCELMT